MQQFDLPTEMPTTQMSNTEFIEWLMTNVVHEPERKHHFSSLQLLQQLSFGAKKAGKTMQPISRKEMFKSAINYMHNKNYCEQLRCGIIQVPTEDYIEYAHLKEKIYKK